MVFGRFICKISFMEKIKISHNFEVYKITFFISAIVILVCVFFHKMEYWFGLIAFILSFIFYKRWSSLKCITYDKADFIYIKNEIKIPITAITEILILDKKRIIWQLNYIDENLNLQSIKFSPVEFTFKIFRKTLLEKNKNVLVEDFI